MGVLQLLFAAFRLGKLIRLEPHPVMLGFVNGLAVVIFLALRKIPRSDALIVVPVTVVTVFTDLAIAVVLGVVIAALVFAWQHTKQINVKTYKLDKGWKVYELEGPLFFASAAGFAGLFTPKYDPEEVVVAFRRSKVVDHSAIEAVDALATRYQQAGKRLHLRHLSPDCLELLNKANDMVEVNTHEDPHYHIADSKLG